MISRSLVTVFSSCGVIGLLAIAGCGSLLGLDEYTENSGGAGGVAGMGNGGEAGQGGGQGECVPDEMASCYEGPPGSDGKGLCKAGQRTCGADGKYGPCVGQVVPQLENCVVPTDEDCNGSAADCTGFPTWAVAYGSGTNHQFGAAVAGMTDGSVVVTGDFTDTFAIGACSMISTSGSVPNIFLAKLDANGTCISAKEFGADTSYDYGYDVAIASNDDIILTGGFTSAGIDFGGDTFAAAGSNDVYVAKFNKDVGHLWSKRFGDSKDQLAYSVGLDANDNIFIAGDFGGALDFGDGIAVSVTPFGQTAGFVAKLDPMGKALYGRSFEVAPNAGDYVSQTSAAVDAQGYATVAGRFRGALTVGNEMLTSSGTAADIFVIRYAPDGTLVYARKFGSIDDEWAPHLATGPDGSVYISGKTLGTSLNFDYFVMNKTVSGAGGGDAYVVKLNPDGSFSDAKVYGNAGDQDSTNIAVDRLGHVILGGVYQGQIDFGKGPLNATPKTLYLAKLDANLGALWSKGFYSNMSESNIKIGTDASANILLTGGFAGSLSIVAGMPLMQQGNGDIFVAKLAP